MIARALVAALALAAGLGTPGVGTAAAATPAGGATEAAVRGFVVRLQDAPAHGRQGLPVRESQRWQRLIDESGLGAPSGRRAPALHPVGRDQQVLRFERPLSAAEAAALRQRIAARPEVAWVEPLRRERRLQVPDDPFFPQQWWLAPVSGTDANLLADRRRGLPGFRSAWTLGTGTSAAVIAVLDTGITPHPDLAGRVLAGYDFVSDLKFGADGDGRDADPSDPGDAVTAVDLADPHFSGCASTGSSWHGTVIAGLVAGATDNRLGVAAINWNGRVLPVRVAGKCGADSTDIVEGMRWAAGLPACRRDDGAGTCVEFAPTNPTPAKVVNISFGGNAACGPVYQAAVDELKADGVVVVAAAGNEHARVTRPANCRDVVGVAGLARDGYKTHYSSFGAELAATGIATVAGDDGEDPAARWNALADEGIVSIGNAGSTTATAPDFAPGYFHFWGTSFAAPIVSGTVGLMLSANPALSWAQIVDGLRRSARPHVSSATIGLCADANPGRCICTGATCGAGILDAEQAVLYARNPAAYIAPARTPARIDPPDIVQLAALHPQDRVANVAPPVAPPSSSGGGAVSAGWLVLLALAAAALRRPSARAGRR